MFTSVTEPLALITTGGHAKSAGVPLPPAPTQSPPTPLCGFCLIAAGSVVVAHRTLYCSSAHAQPETYVLRPEASAYVQRRRQRTSKTRQCAHVML